MPERGPSPPLTGAVHGPGPVGGCGPGTVRGCEPGTVGGRGPVGGCGVPRPPRRTTCSGTPGTTGHARRRSGVPGGEHRRLFVGVTGRCPVTRPGGRGVARRALGRRSRRRAPRCGLTAGTGGPPGGSRRARRDGGVRPAGRSRRTGRDGSVRPAGSFGLAGGSRRTGRGGGSGRAGRDRGVPRFRAHAPPRFLVPGPLPRTRAVLPLGRARRTSRPGHAYPYGWTGIPVHLVRRCVPPYVRVTLRLVGGRDGTGPRARGICPERPPTLR
ncbi:hypothetical protein FHS34_006043 [Streptomyces echinatus]|uniref:Uncharacterized protein n=1 Tax=Streptomyces echinatus TaxID=67293 RepID=A0A7W9PYZ8_9ACTN|nr:hypothetical protein [Streptomyces echinatus]